jgi:hypothetical protein
MADVVVSTSRHMDEFTSATDASTTTAMTTAPTTGRERTGASTHSYVFEIIKIIFFARIIMHVLLNENKFF